MLSISRSQVPEYLRNGAFYESLAIADEKFDVPSNCLKTDLRVDSNGDLRNLLHSLRFWGVRNMLADVFCAVLRSTGVSSTFPFANEFPDYEEFLSKVFPAKASKGLVCALAIELGLGLSTLHTLHKEMGYTLGDNCWDAAISKDDVQTFIYLLQKNVPIYKPIMPIIASYGSMNVLRYAHSQQWKCTADDLHAAIKFNRVECVKFLHEACGVAFAAGSMRHAAQYGQLPLIKYLHKSECSWEPEVCAVFSSRDLLGSLMFARKNGCQWDARTCSAAAKRGSLRCLQYAHQQGCPWDSETTDDAHFFGKEECFNYAHSSGCPLSVVMRDGRKMGVCVAFLLYFLAVSIVTELPWELVAQFACLILGLLILMAQQHLEHLFHVRQAYVMSAAVLTVFLTVILLTVSTYRYLL
jgi:hypothetical protein